MDSVDSTKIRLISFDAAIIGSDKLELVYPQTGDLAEKWELVNIVFQCRIEGHQTYTSKRSSRNGTAVLLKGTLTTA